MPPLNSWPKIVQRFNRTLRVHTPKNDDPMQLDTSSNRSIVVTIYIYTRSDYYTSAFYIYVYICMYLCNMRKNRYIQSLHS